MSFVNREIQAEDRALYALDEAEASKPRGVLLPELSWTVDDDRQIYLRGMGSSARGPEPQQNPKSILHRFHFHANGVTYLLSIENDLTRRVSNSSNKHWTLAEHWVLKDIDRHDSFTASPDFVRILTEAMTASIGGNAHMALRLENDGWSAEYKLNLKTAMGF